MMEVAPGTYVYTLNFARVPVKGFLPPGGQGEVCSSIILHFLDNVSKKRLYDSHDHLLPLEMWPSKEIMGLG